MVQAFNGTAPAAPNATVFVKPFAHAAHVWREDGGKGALVVVVEGRDDLSYPNGVPQKDCFAVERKRGPFAGSNRQRQV